MRVSRIGEGFRHLARPGMGLGLAVALYGLLVWVPSALFQGDPAPMPLVGYVPSVVNAVVLMTLAALRHPRILLGRPAGALACFLVLAGVVPWVVGGGQAGSLPLPVVVAGGAAAGAGVALLFARWLESLALDEGVRSRRALVEAAFVSALINIGSGLLPQRESWLVALACALVEAALLMRPGADGAISAGNISSPDESNVYADGYSRFDTRAQPALTPRVLLPVLITAVVLTFAAPLVNTVLMEDSLDLSNRLMLSSTMNLAVAVLLCVSWLAPKRPPSVFALLLGFTGVFFVAIVLVWVAGLHAVTLLLGLGSAAFFLVSYLVMEACLEVGRAGGGGCMRAYGVVGGLVMLARVGADVASAYLHNSGIADESKTLIAVFLLVYLLTCVAFVLYGAVARGKAQATLMDVSAVTSLEEPVSSAPDVPAGWMLLARQCDRVSREFNLSQREHEVLSLIMRGRNVPAVAEELTVSRNTVQTHVRHIYEHLGVHSRQELVTFVTEFGTAAGAVAGGVQGAATATRDVS